MSRFFSINLIIIGAKNLVHCHQEIEAKNSLLIMHAECRFEFNNNNKSGLLIKSSCLVISELQNYFTKI